MVSFSRIFFKNIGIETEMDLKLGGKKVLITGGSKGIGLACAKVFLMEGASVAIVSRSNENLAKAEDFLDKFGKVRSFCFDLISPGDAKKMVSTVKDDMEGIDILVNSAGAAKQAPVGELKMDSWQKAMDAKYFTYMFAIQAVLPLMREQKTGNIVNIIGTGGKFPLPFHIPGGAANAALMLTTSGLAGVSGDLNIRINGVNPGYIKTERLKHILDAKSRDTGINADDLEQKITSDIPLGRMGEGEDVANLVAFLASPKSSYITGSNIPIDGGLSLAI